MWPLVIFARFYFFYFLTQVENSNFILKISGTRRTTDAIDVSHLTSPSTFSFFFLSFLSLSRCRPSHLFKLLSRDKKKTKKLMLLLLPFYIIYLFPLLLWVLCVELIVSLSL
jgi:hypothetical protein